MLNIVLPTPPNLPFACPQANRKDKMKEVVWKVGTQNLSKLSKPLVSMSQLLFLECNSQKFYLKALAILITSNSTLRLSHKQTFKANYPFNID